MINKSEIIIECKDVCKSFRIRKQSVEILKNLNLQVKRGELLVVEGKSGAGKSTMMNIISGIESISRGEVFCNGISYRNLNNEALAQNRQNNIGIIFQNFNLISLWTAYENIEAAFINSKLSKIERRELIESYMEELNVLQYKDHKPNELSVGQQQRIAIIRALINEPQLILGDEPTGDVDKETASEILALIHRIRKKNNSTMIVTTHGEFPTDIADRVLRMSDGVLTNK